MSRERARGLALTGGAMIAFASDSLLCRLALRERHIDASSFTALRLGSGALLLTLLVRPRAGSDVRSTASWASALALFAYASAFSFAYLWLDAGVGALVLFGAPVGAACAAERRRPGRARRGAHARRRGRVGRLLAARCGRTRTRRRHPAKLRAQRAVRAAAR